jgi:hypothetical protein
MGRISILVFLFKLINNLYSASIVLRHILNHYIYKLYYISYNRQEEVSTILIKGK